MSAATRDISSLLPILKIDSKTLWQKTRHHRTKLIKEVGLIGNGLAEIFFCVLCSCAIFNIFKPTNLAGLRQFLCFTKAVHCSSPWIISLISAFSEGNLSFETIEYGLVCWLYNKLWKKGLNKWDWLVQQGNSLLFSHCILGVNNMWKCKGYLWDITL